MNLTKLKNFLESLKLNEEEKNISSLVLKEIINRLTFLENVGLNYLTLNRSAETLSGGEAQRIRLATQIGSKLSGVLYVLDEPSIGLHQRDNQRLINSLKEMRDLGNTLIVVEHDTDTMLASDFLVDIGSIKEAAVNKIKLKNKNFFFLSNYLLYILFPFSIFFVYLFNCFFIGS